MIDEPATYGDCLEWLRAHIEPGRGAALDMLTSTFTAPPAAAAAAGSDGPADLLLASLRHSHVSGGEFMIVTTSDHACEGEKVAYRLTPEAAKQRHAALSFRRTAGDPQSPKPSAPVADARDAVPDEENVLAWISGFIPANCPVKRAVLIQAACQTFPRLSEPTLRRYLDKACAPQGPYRLFDQADPENDGARALYIGRRGDSDAAGPRHGGDQSGLPDSHGGAPQ